MNQVQQTRQVLDLLIPNLQAEGYTVYLQPTPQFLPPFMKGYVPDAIALGSLDGQKNLAIEIIVDGSKPKEKRRDLKRLFEGQSKWERRLYYARPTALQIKATTKSVIETSISDVEKLIVEGRSGPALLMAWATLEGLGRLLLPKKLGRPQTPETLLDVLAGDGYVTPSEADLLRSLKQVRNHLVHGMLEQTVSSAEFAKFIEVLKLLLTFVKQPAR
jgi:uncharacterized protein YutE (UPF0331/DUF86 family)